MKQGQTKAQSWIEILFSTAVGFLVALVTQSIVFPLYGFEVSHAQNLQLTMVFTIVSIIRGYAMRRLFNWWHTR